MAQVGRTWRQTHALHSTEHRLLAAHQQAGRRTAYHRLVREGHGGASHSELGRHTHSGLAANQAPGACQQNQCNQPSRAAPELTDARPRDTTIPWPKVTEIVLGFKKLLLGREFAPTAACKSMFRIFDRNKRAKALSPDAADPPWPQLVLWLCAPCACVHMQRGRRAVSTRARVATEQPVAAGTRADRACASARMDGDARKTPRAQPPADRDKGCRC